MVKEAIIGEIYELVGAPEGEVKVKYLGEDVEKPFNDVGVVLENLGKFKELSFDSEEEARLDPRKIPGVTFRISKSVFEEIFYKR